MLPWLVMLMPMVFMGGIRCCTVLFHVAVNPKCSLATHLPRWRPHPAVFGGGSLALPLAGDLRDGLRDGVRVRGYFIMVLLMMWMTAATRRSACVFDSFVSVLYVLLEDWARACECAEHDGHLRLQSQWLVHRTSTTSCIIESRKINFGRTCHRNLDIS